MEIQDVNPSKTSERTDEKAPVETQRGASPQHSCVSMRSNHSRDQPLYFNTGLSPVFRDETIESPPGYSTLQMEKQDVISSKTSERTDEKASVETQRAASPQHSCVSMRSNHSRDQPLYFNTGLSPVFRDETIESPPGYSCGPKWVQVQSNCKICKQILQDPVSISCGHSFCRECINWYWDKPKQEDFCCPQCREKTKKHTVLNTHKVIGVSSSAGVAYSYTSAADVFCEGTRRSVSRLTYTASLCQSHITQYDTEAALPTHIKLEDTENMQHDSYKPMESVMQKVKDIHKASMIMKYEGLFEGIKLDKNKTLLKKMYTQLYVIEGESEEVNDEHEVLHMEKTTRTHSQGTPINCNDIFDLLPKPGFMKKKMTNGKTVLTKGIAGIGKTVSVHKFILDWAEGKANQNVDFMFILPFRELNLVKGNQCSLHSLLMDFYPELQELNLKIFDECKIVFIFDGLDESRMTLNFSDSEKVSHVTETSSVSELMSNLIKGELLPYALIWITSRPAAANQIPSEYINCVTEIQGFDEPQKEEYFRKRISDERQASRIISQIRRARTLHIMCHIPVFCWISATVLQNILTQDYSAEIPKTLTEMYIYFLMIQTNMKHQKYDEKDEKDPDVLLESNKEVIVKLAELAFKQLIKGNVMFYEEDLRECGIDVTDASVYSGIFTEIFKQESVIYQRKVYSFIHLSFQEFLAAVFVFHCLVSKNPDVLQFFDLLHSLQREAVDKALQSENGHFDLFLRFLLGISLDSNQILLKGLLTHRMNSSESIKKTVTYIKDKIKNGQSLSEERSINLFLCLHEMNDPTLYEEIQEFLKSEKLSGNKISTAHCSAIAYMLQMSEKVLDKLDLMKYNTSDEGRKRLIPAVMNCRQAILADCNLTGQCYVNVASALQLPDSPLRHLDLSNNDLHDSGLKLLSDGLKSPHCKLNILRLSGCMVTGEGCSHLVSALRLNPLHLKELDLSYNHLEDSGVKLLSDLMKDPHCTLEKLNVDHGGQSRITPGLQKYACELTLDPNTAHAHLCLSEGNRKVTYVNVKQLYPDHLERFKKYEQVLCRESLTGRFYWEAEWTGFRTDIAVTYKGNSMEGEGHDDRFGLNKNSWGLIFYNNNYYVRHNNKRTDIPLPSPPSNRVGVYLDWFTGTLSFYSVSNTHKLTHLHTFYSTFTEPLYAGFRVGVDSGSSVSLCQSEPHF